MLEWLHDTLANTSSSLSYRHSMIPSPFFRRQQQNKKVNENRNSISSPFDDEDDNDNTDDEESNDNSFYHNPYHSSGLMNYVDLPQQQYTNEHNYPTYLIEQQNQEISNQSVDDQIRQKLFSIQQRGNSFQLNKMNQQYDYAYRNRLVEKTNLKFVSNLNKQKIEEEKIDKDINEENNDYKIRTYYPGQYPNLNGHYDFPSVVLWYRNVMQSVKKFM